MLIRCNYINQVRCRGKPWRCLGRPSRSGCPTTSHPAPPTSNTYLASRALFLYHFSPPFVYITLSHPRLFFLFLFSSVLFPSSSISPPSPRSSSSSLPPCLRLLQYPLKARTRRSHMRPENMCRTCNLRHVDMINKRAVGPLHDEAWAEEARWGREQRGYDSLAIMSRPMEFLPALRYMQTIICPHNTDFIMGCNSRSGIAFRCWSLN